MPKNGTFQSFLRFAAIAAKLVKSRQIDRDKMDSKESKVNYPLKCKK